MKLELWQTGQLTEMDGVPVRVWRGVSGDGVPVIAFIHRLAVVARGDNEAFQRELVEKGPPTLKVPLSEVL